MGFILMEGILFIAILFLLYLLSMFWPPDSPWSPWWTTSKDVARVMCRLVKMDSKDTLYDLGSGNGTALITASSEFGAKGVGIEIDPLRFAISRYLIDKYKLKNKLQIIRKNFFAVDISPATVIFIYLVPKALMRLKPKFLKELKPGTKIVSYRYPINYLPLIKEEKLHKIYVYTIPKTQSKKIAKTEK